MSGIENRAFVPIAVKNNGQTLTRRKPEVEVKITDQPVPDYPEPDYPQDNTSLDEAPEKGSTAYWFRLAKILVINVAVIIYFVFATIHFLKQSETCDTVYCKLALCSPYGMLLFVSGAVYLGLVYYKLFKPFLGKHLYERCLGPMTNAIKRTFSSLSARIILFCVCLALLAGYIVFETYEDFSRCRSLIGIFALILIAYVFSNNPTKINWRPVICGAFFQFALGVFCIRWDVGRAIFKCFGDKVAEFLNYSMEGAAFVFGDFLVYEQNVFAFTALPTIFFFSLCISVLYYLGAMQWALFKLGWILQSILGTTVCESVNAAGNIFLGMSEGPLLIKPYIKSLTNSEIHSIMASGFATVSGTVLAAYISFGAEPSQLITASVMAAPASLFVSKLLFPETEESKTSSDNIVMEKSTDSSLLDAASNGAGQGISLILNIIANLVAFVAFVAFADGMLKWVTMLLGYDNVGIQFIFGKIFIPLSWAMGVDWVDCEAVGKVIGTKTVINEFVAYKLLGEFKEANVISLRSSAIATYAICGFANPSSLGIMIGALSALAPERRKSITSVALRAFLAGSIVCFISACIAGLLMTDAMIEGTGNSVKIDTIVDNGNYTLN